ncbi:Type 1 phosphatases regulator ypi1 [Arachnomyces sp. PD_36]|nr:Type 1 phosphatases regulator ypi1 [Arachnomyces sp. PD_36]
MSRNREGASTPTTTTQVEPSNIRLTGTLRLRGEHLPTQQDSTEQGPSSSRRIRWAEDVVDNEGLGRKSSKVCCIFHKSRPAGESSSESDSEPSSSSDESDSDIDTGEARASNRQPLRHRQRQGRCPERDHDHEHVHDHEHGDDEDCGDHDDEPGKKTPTQRKRKYRPNAYERIPKNNEKKPDKGKDAS